MPRFLDILFQEDGILGVSDDFWLNVISEVVAGVFLIGFFTYVLRKIGQRNENRLRRYERSSKATRLFTTYNSLLFFWSLNIKKVAELFSLTLSRKPNSKEPLPSVLSAQLTGVRHTISQNTEALAKMENWFEENYSIYPLGRHPQIDELERNVREFCTMFRSYNNLFEQIVDSNGDKLKLAVMLINQDRLFEMLDGFIFVAKRFPEKFTAAFADYPLDLRPMRVSTIAELDLEPKHTAFINAVKTYSEMVTTNFNKRASDLPNNSSSE